jgi:hypothetical protein
MALKACRECKQKVSTKAKICPHCGAPVKKHYSLGKILLIGLLGLIVFSCTVNLFTQPKETKNEMVQKKEITSPKFIYDIEILSYIESTDDSANILNYPRSNADVVATAKKGDLFKPVSEDSNWYKIKMFTGSDRYISKNHSRSTTIEISSKIVSSIPEPKRRRIFMEMVGAEGRAQEEADQLYPMTIKDNIDRNIAYNSLLKDRYKLAMAHKFDILLPTYDKIVIEGVEKIGY